MGKRPQPGQELFVQRSQELLIADSPATQAPGRKSQATPAGKEAWWNITNLLSRPGSNEQMVMSNMVPTLGGEADIQVGTHECQPCVPSSHCSRLPVDNLWIR